MEERRLLTPTVNAFPLPTANDWPTFIAAGPDGAVWFAETLQGQNNFTFLSSRWADRGRTVSDAQAVSQSVRLPTRTRPGP
jgi:hypothetical protein